MDLTVVFRGLKCLAVFTILSPVPLLELRVIWTKSKFSGDFAKLSQKLKRSVV